MRYFEIANETYELITTAQKLKLQNWIEYVVFTPLWWLGISLSIVPWIFWIFYHKSKSRNRMLFVGFIVMIIASFFDFLGTQLGLWMYYYEVFPWIPAYEPWDFTLLPVIILLLIEYKPDKPPVIKAIIFAALTAFVGEPIFEFLGLYRAINWSILYSFPIYFLIFMFANWLSKRKNFEPYWTE